MQSKYTQHYWKQSVSDNGFLVHIDIYRARISRLPSHNNTAKRKNSMSLALRSGQVFDEKEIHFLMAKNQSWIMFRIMRIAYISAFMPMFNGTPPFFVSFTASNNGFLLAKYNTKMLFWRFSCCSCGRTIQLLISCISILSI